MSIQVRRINQNIGAEILNVDLSQPLFDADFEVIYKTWIEYFVA